jgi:hypothetical protein
MLEGKILEEDSSNKMPLMLTSTIPNNVTAPNNAIRAAYNPTVTRIPFTNELSFIFASVKFIYQYRLSCLNIIFK